MHVCLNRYQLWWPKASEVAQSCPTLCDPMDCSPPGSSVHGVFQGRVLEWAAISFFWSTTTPRQKEPRNGCPPLCPLALSPASCQWDLTKSQRAGGPFGEICAGQAPSTNMGREGWKLDLGANGACPDGSVQRQHGIPAAACLTDLGSGRLPTSPLLVLVLLSFCTQLVHSLFSKLS